MSLKILVTSQTDANTSDSFYVPENGGVTIKVVPNLDGVETVVVQIALDNETFIDYEDGALVKLDSAENAIKLYGPAYYKVVKSATASATAVQKLD